VLNQILTPEKFAELSEEQQEILACASLARFDTPQGFEGFYGAIHGNPMPRHCRAWVREMYDAHEKGIGFLLFAWRGSWKTTTMVQTFTAFRIGHEPHKTNMIVCANDLNAENITKAIAELIENNPMWKIMFPNVEPDKDRGWGAMGYWVKNINYSKEEWSQKQSKVIDPTFFGGGIGSSILIGKHPSGVLAFDDIHDEKNSFSQREREGIIRKVTEVLLPTTIKKKEDGMLSTWLNVIGTPWDTDDAYHVLKNTGQFHFVNAPVMKTSDGKNGAVYIDGVNRDGIVFDDIVGWWDLAWKNRFPEQAIIRERATGKRSFYKMYMLDLLAAKSTRLKYYTYPHENVDPRWAKYGGVDLATVITKKVVPDPGRDYFSMAYGTLTPLNQLVIYDGVFEQCTQAQAETYIANAQRFPNWQNTVLEGDGIGETFYISYMMRNPGARVRMDKTKGKGKVYRQEQEMGPWLETARVLVSDGNTPYLNALRKALDDFPEGNNDIRDGLYWCCKAAPMTVFRNEMSEDELPQPVDTKKKQKNPFCAIGRRKAAWN